MKPDLELGNVVEDILDIIKGISNRKTYPEYGLYYNFKQSWRYFRYKRLLKKYFYTMKKDVNNFYKKYKRSK